MNSLTRRIAKMERANSEGDDLPLDIRTASDRQLEVFLLTAGINPHDDGALGDVARLGTKTAGLEPEPGLRSQVRVCIGDGD